MARRYLVGTDGSPTAAKAVDRAVEVAAAAGATLTILAVGPDEQAEKIVRTECERVAGSGVELETATGSGHPSKALTDMALAGGYDMLIVGNRGMTGLSRLLGSVPNRVMHDLPCTLLIVKTT